MNLTNFIKYRRKCLVCQSKLQISAYFTIHDRIRLGGITYKMNEYDGRFYKNDFTVIQNHADSLMKDKFNGMPEIFSVEENSITILHPDLNLLVFEAGCQNYNNEHICHCGYNSEALTPIFSSTSMFDPEEINIYSEWIYRDNTLIYNLLDNRLNLMSTKIYPKYDIVKGLIGSNADLETTYPLTFWPEPLIKFRSTVNTLIILR